MTRWILSAAVAVLSVGGVMADDSKKADPPAAEKKADNPFLKAKEEFERDADALIQKIRQAQTADDQLKYKAQLRELQTRFLAKLVSLAEKHPGTEETLHLLSELVGLGGEHVKRAAELIASHHVEQAWVTPAIPALAQADDPAAAAALAAIAEKNPDKRNRGLAHLFLGLSHKRQVRNAPESRQAEHVAAAEKALTTAKTDYADEKLSGRETVGKAAAAQLIALKNLPNLVVGRTAPDLIGEDLDGKPMKLSDYRGKVVLLDFWATWCPPCMKLVPHNRELVESYKDRPFILLGVNVDQDETELQAALKRHKINWRSFKNEAGDAPPITEQWDVQGFPTIYLLDHEGVIRKVWEGLPDVDVMEKEVAELVAAAEKK
jgi:thiol-disulfide isomerase/thioredoxin